jgi:hypothetical protein
MFRRLLLLFPLAIGCGSRTEPFGPTVAPGCSSDPPECIVDGIGCARSTLATPVCESTVWRCPTNARPHVRVEPKSCTFEVNGSLPAVPTDDGRCVWIADDQIVAEIDRAAPFGTCPVVAPTKKVIHTDDPSLIVQITGGYRIKNTTRVTYRLFRNDPAGPFGITELGTGIGRWRGDQIVIDETPRFAPDLDLGDASIAFGDHAYVFGCPPPIDFLTEKCVVGRVDERDAMELFAGGNRWVASTRGRDGEPLFDAGPWVSSVTARPSGGFLHVYAVGFGSDLQTHVASKIEGPWEKGPNLGRCELPPGDDKAFCAGPVVHEELIDPTRPNELVVSYGRGSTRPDAGEQHPVLAWFF